MTDLSPAARAVLTAVTWKKYDVPPEGLPAFAEEMAPLIAAALRATAKQLATYAGVQDGYQRYLIDADAILAIAAELEGAGAGRTEPNFY